MSSNSVCNHTRDEQIGLPLRGRPILFITRMITDRIGLHSVLLPLLIEVMQTHAKFHQVFHMNSNICFRHLLLLLV